jgi:hypothetical protein
MVGMRRSFSSTEITGRIMYLGMKAINKNSI